MECREIFSRWRSWIRPIVIGFYIILLVIIVPLIVVEFQLSQTQTHVQAWFIGGLFTLMAIPISLWGILQHLVHYTRPILQKNIIRVLWMVPIYGVDAWLALRFKDIAIYLDTVRECYEAWVIYSFMSYLLNFLHSEFSDLELHVSQKPQQKHLVPFCFLPKWRMGREFLEFCKHGVLQYTVIRPITTIIALITELAGVYGEGKFKFSNSWVYLVTIDNFSQIWALYCLVLFYQAMKDELKPLNPLAKFMCVKAVVFMSFWQQVVIAILVAVGVIKAEDTWGDYDEDDVATGLQDFIICIEMFFAAVAHYYSFSHKPYIDPTAEQNDCCQSFLHMWDISDVRQDVAEHVQHVRSTVTRPLKHNIRTGRIETERTPLLSQVDDSDDSGAPFVHAAEDAARAAAGSLPSTAAASDGLLVTHDRADAAERQSTSTVGTFDDASSRRSFNASMNNYVSEFSGSETSSQVEAPQDAPKTDPLPQSSAAVHSEPREAQLIDFTSGDVTHTSDDVTVPQRGSESSNDSRNEVQT